MIVSQVRDEADCAGKPDASMVCVWLRRFRCGQRKLSTGHEAEISVLAIAYFAYCDAVGWRRLSLHPSLLGRKRWD